MCLARARALDAGDASKPAPSTAQFENFDAEAYYWPCYIIGNVLMFGGIAMLMPTDVFQSMSQRSGKDDISVAKRFASIVAMLVLVIGLLALFYYVVHNLSWWGFMLLVIIVAISVLAASSRCRASLRAVIE